MTSLTGKLCVTTTTYGPSRTRTALACLIKSCKNWSGQKEKSMVAPIKLPCLLWIPKASAMQIPLRKRAMMRENLRNKAAYRSLCHGLLHAIYMTTANITDRSGAINMVEYGCNVKKSIPSPEKSGRWRLYQTKFADTIRGILRTEVEVVKQNEHHTFSISFSFTSIVTLQILQFRIQKNP